MNAPFYENLLRETVPLLRAKFTPDCCLNASWIVSELLRRAGVPNEALMVDVTAMNADAAAAVTRLGRFPMTRAEAGSRAWMVMVDSSPEQAPGKFGGHVVVLAESRVLIDASAGQMNRPEKRLFVRPVWCEVDGFWRTGVAPVALGLKKGGWLLYQARPNDRRHLDADGFRASAHNVAAADAVWARLERRSA